MCPRSRREIVGSCRDLGHQDPAKTEREMPTSDMYNLNVTAIELNICTLHVTLDFVLMHQC